MLVITNVHDMVMDTCKNQMVTNCKYKCTKCMGMSKEEKDAQEKKKKPAKINTKKSRPSHDSVKFFRTRLIKTLSRDVSLMNTS